MRQARASSRCCRPDPIWRSVSSSSRSASCCCGFCRTGRWHGCCQAAIWAGWRRRRGFARCPACCFSCYCAGFCHADFLERVIRWKIRWCSASGWCSGWPRRWCRGSCSISGAGCRHGAGLPARSRRWRRARRWHCRTVLASGRRSCYCWCSRCSPLPTRHRMIRRAWRRLASPILL